MKDYNNLSTGEQDGLNKLQKNKNIVIKPADKGSATVLMNRTDYIKEAERQLNNNKYYIKCNQPLCHENVKKIHKVLVEMLDKKYITKDQLNYLSGPEDYRPRIFYLLPKIHKKHSTWPQEKMPEGRPIVSDVNSETYRVSEFIDHFLNPLAVKHFSYIKNSFEFVKKIKNTKIEKNYLLVTGDVSSLYTNMNIDRMLECTKQAFNNNPDRSRPDAELLRLLEISLKNNDFVFNGQCYQQILGCAMGKRFAPALANLYLLEFDDKATAGYPIKPLLYTRYLDDVFFLWPGDVESLKDFERFLNNLIPDIKITLECSDKEIPFLDTLIFIQDSTLQTRTFFKPTDTHQLLHTDSFHPKHTFEGLLKSQLIRFKRLSSNKMDYDNTCKILFSRLINRGYTWSQMRKKQHEIWHNYVEKQTDDVTPNVTDKEKFPIILDYRAFGKDLAKSYKLILNNNTFLNNYQLVTAFKNHKNIQKILVKSELERASKAGAFRGCGKPNCATCSVHASDACYFYNQHNKTKYNIEDNIYCNSTNLVYLINCRKCKMQYVGETGRTLRDRLNDHRSAIRNKTATPISIHFNLPGHSTLDLAILPIELIKNTSKTNFFRRGREQFWQLKLNTLYPNGINNTPTD